MIKNNKLQISNIDREKFFEKPALTIQQAVDKLIDYVIEESDFIIPIIVIGSLVSFTIYQIYSMINQEQPLENLTKYIYLIFIPITIIFSYILYISFDNKSKYLFYLFCAYGIVVFFIIYGIVLGSQFKFNLTLQSLFSYIFVATIVIFSLSIFYNIFENQLRTTDTWGSFWIEMLCYVPCMIEKFVKYMIKDYTETSNSTIVLLIIEIILILIYFYIYPTYKDSIYNNSVVLIKKPVFLNNITSRLIQPMKNIYADRIQPPINSILSMIQQQDQSMYPYRVNYAISMWIYVNPMPMSRMGYVKETNIFSYGTPTITPTIEYHPKISLVQENNNYLFNFYYSGNEATHQLELPLQKWNNIVLNYINNGVDVFINGKLSLSYNFSNDMPIYSDDDDIFVGDTNGIANTNANGLYGSICNIVYYMTPLTKREIVLNYNMLSMNNPPL